VTTLELGRLSDRHPPFKERASVVIPDWWREQLRAFERGDLEE